MAIVGSDPITREINSALLTQQAQALAPTITATNSRTSNMDATSLAALQTLIKNLQGQQAASTATFQQGQQAATQGIGDYSKDAAFADAQGAMQANLADALAKLLPSIVRGAEGAGTSQSSMRALLTQQAASEAAKGSAALGLQAATDYGQIANQYLNSLTNANNTGDAITNALLDALGVAKGAVTNTQSVQSQGKDADYTSVQGVMGGTNKPVELRQYGAVGSFGNGYTF
jgi:hypothetical protein